MIHSRENRLRLFFALWPSKAERAALAAWQPPLQELCGGRVMRGDNLHATLVFLGDVAEHRMEALQLAAQETEFAGFELNWVRAHYWGHNRIVYAAPEEIPAQLAELVSELERNLRRHRFRFEQRTYKPHVTLLRHAKWTDAQLPGLPDVRWQVRDFALVQSSSDEQGARYDVLAHFGAPELE
jgi:2'-5' RNA ligase